MKLTDNRKTKAATFGDLSTGDAFEFGGMIWLKTTYEEAFNLEDEEIDSFYNDTAVYRVKISITVED